MATYGIVGVMGTELVESITERALAKAKTTYLIEWLEDGRREARAMHHIAMDPAVPPAIRASAVRAAVAVRSQLLEIACLPTRPRGASAKPVKAIPPGVTLELHENGIQTGGNGVEVDTFPELEAASPDSRRRS